MMSTHVSNRSIYEYIPKSVLNSIRSSDLNMHSSTMMKKVHDYVLHNGYDKAVLIVLVNRETYEGIKVFDSNIQQTINTTLHSVVLIDGNVLDLIRSQYIIPYDDFITELQCYNNEDIIINSKLSSQIKTGVNLEDATLENIRLLV